VSLNIKNERVHDLVRQAAARTGKSQTSVVEEALRRYLDQLERERSQADRDRRVDELLADIHARIAADPRSYDSSTDFLYDENGLPA
jgi:antitoxin VapB